MIPPTSIDGTDITGATIDGTDVQEITVDGDTVFTAGPSLQDIVAPGDLIAWYPFTNGDARDETRTGGILDNAGITVGDSSDYSPTSSSGSFGASNGVFDLQEGANSGGYDSSGSDVLDIDGIPLSDPLTFTFWANPDALASTDWTLSTYNNNANDLNTGFNGDGTYRMADDNTTSLIDSSSSASIGNWTHIGMGYFGNENVIFFDGQRDTSQSSSPGRDLNDLLYIGALFDGRSGDFDGQMDDVRVYNAELTDSQVQKIYDNTDPNQNP